MSRDHSLQVLTKAESQCTRIKEKEVTGLFFSATSVVQFFIFFQYHQLIFFLFLFFLLHINVIYLGYFSKMKEIMNVKLDA